MRAIIASWAITTCTFIQGEVSERSYKSYIAAREKMPSGNPRYERDVSWGCAVDSIRLSGDNLEVYRQGVVGDGMATLPFRIDTGTVWIEYKSWSPAVIRETYSAKGGKVVLSRLDTARIIPAHTVDVPAKVEWK